MMLTLSNQASLLPLKMTQDEFNKILKSLTRQEERVLRRYLEGHDDPEIANTLFCQESTVRSHLSKICKSFGITQSNPRCSHRDDLILLFLQYQGNWVSPQRRKQVGYPEFEYPNGAVRLNSPFYMERPYNHSQSIESFCKAEILKPGTLLRIKAPKLMGKTSLLIRLLDASRQQENIRTVEVNFVVTQEKLDSPEQFFQWFCETVSEKLELENCLSDYWKDYRGRIQNCTVYFERYLLPQINCPLILAMDEVDRIFPYAVAQEFLPMLRLWNEETRTSTVWENMRLIIAYSTEVYVKIQNNQSPFTNVGIDIKLSDFSREEVQTLAIRHGLSLENSQVEDLMGMLEGHPYLVRLALYYLGSQRSSLSLEKLLRKAPTQEGIYSDHLQKLLTILEKNDALAQAYKEVVNVKKAQSSVELKPIQTRLLDSMGLVKKQDNQVMPRCRLYQEYFSHWL